jgi:parallel beta-helix repeat protein
MVYDYGGAPYSNYLGNYWNDLNGLDENGDGISENPLIISDNPEYYMDLYPLIKATEYYILQNSTYMPSFLEIDGYDLPVLITGNEELELFAERRNWSGEGTYLSPYIIENLVIDSKTHFAMHISNTNAYIIIRNCTVFGGDRSFMLDRTEGGIYFLGVKNILVKNNSLIGNYNGISIAYSENMTVTLNNISANRNYGVYLKLGSTNNIIYGNNIYNNGNAQAYESGDSTNNNWDNGTIGNYWGDSFLNVTSNPRENGYYWRKPYEISGDGEGVDNFPLVNPIIGGFGSIDLDSASTISGFNGYFSVLGLISVLVILTKIKKKIKISKILI